MLGRQGYEVKQQSDRGTPSCRDRQNIERGDSESDACSVTSASVPGLRSRQMPGARDNALRFFGDVLLRGDLGEW